MAQKRRPERLTVRLKLLTPDERKTMTTEMDRVQQMWKSLYARNKWKPEIISKKTLASRKTNATLTNLD
jgi:predicted type IV restriction endonuclease